MGDIESGRCDICNKTVNSLERHYYRYAIKCTCCNDINSPHFEVVRHCKDCKPKPPRTVTAIIEPSNRPEEDILFFWYNVESGIMPPKFVHVMGYVDGTARCVFYDGTLWREPFHKNHIVDVTHWQFFEKIKP